MGREVIEGLDLGNNTRVRFDAAAILQLIEQAKSGVRVHELMSVTQLGDVSDYLQATIERDVPEPGADRDHRSIHPDYDANSPLTYEQFLKLTRCFDASDGWRSIVHGKAFQEFVMGILDEVVSAQRVLRENSNPLIRYELDLVDRHRHPRELALVEGGLSLHDRTRQLDITPVYGPGFYACLTDLVALMEVRSLSYCGSADFQTLRIACLERVRRRDAADSSGGTFEIHVLDMHGRWGTESTHDYDDGYRYALDSAPAWFEGIRFYSEGLGHGDLFIDDTVSRSDFPEIIEHHWHGAILIATQPVVTLHPEMEWYRHAEGFCVGLRKSAATDGCARSALRTVSARWPPIAKMIDDAYHCAADAIAGADGIIIAAGAGMG